MKPTMATNKALKKTKLRHAEYYDFQGIQDKLYAESSKGKEFKHLVELITLPQNIRLAYRNLKKNKGSHTAGTDNKTIDSLAKLPEERLVQLVQRKLSWYVPQSVRRVEIPKGDGRKRPLGIPTILDRLIQQCVLQVLEPICEAKFHDHSYGFRPNRSQEHAMAQVMKNMQQSNLSFVVDVDIHGFFDNVNHGKLLKQIWALGIRDKKLLSIISAMLKAEVAGIGFPEKGTPQGGIISPLLSNIVLNEFDWWIASQWEEFPTRYAYQSSVNSNGSLCKSNKYTALKKRSGLKLCTAVRYADDFKVFTSDHKSAVKLYHATVDWLKHRLGLEISPEKSKVVNLKENYSDFLGFKLKVIQRGKEPNGKPKYVVESHIRDKAIKKIHETLKERTVAIEYPKGSKTAEYEAVSRYNAYVLGIHRYYRFATCIALDLKRLSFHVLKSQVTRLKERIKPIAEIRKKGLSHRMPGYIKTRYGESKMLRFIGGNALIPVGYAHHQSPMSKRRNINSYTPEGRAAIHKSLGIDMTTLNYLMRHPVANQSIEYNDNRLSLYCGQQGKCAVTGEKLLVHDIHCHHKRPNIWVVVTNIRI
jgi:group II intron reverse transcriptase/maturase